MEEVYSPSRNYRFWHHLSKMPNYVAPSVVHIDYDKLISQGIRHFVFDIDNTLTSFGGRTIEPRTIKFLLGLKRRPLVKSLCLATNGTRDFSRVREALDVPIIQPGLIGFKPLPSFYAAVVRSTGAEPAAICMVGDKLIQDIWGANFAGLTTVLVQPVGRDNWLDRLLHVRSHERRLLRKYLPEHIETWF